MDNIDKIKDTQDTIDALLKIGSLSSNMEEHKWVLEPLAHNDDVNAGFVHIEKVTYGACKPHVHPESKEYLICIKGAFILNINGDNVRTINEGGCAVVNPGEMHYSKPLFDNTKIMYICIPDDKGMSILTEQLRRKDVRGDNQS